MKPKKHLQKDLSKNSPLFFVIGLSITLAAVWGMMEMRTYTPIQTLEAVAALEDNTEDIPLVNIEKPLPPPPPVIPKDPEIVPDDDDTPETFFASTESEPGEIIPDVIDYDDPIDDIIPK